MNQHRLTYYFLALTVLPVCFIQPESVEANSESKESVSIIESVIEPRRDLIHEVYYSLNMIDDYKEAIDQAYPLLTNFGKGTTNLARIFFDDSEQCFNDYLIKGDKRERTAGIVALESALLVLADEFYYPYDKETTHRFISKKRVFDQDRLWVDQFYRDSIRP